MHMACTGPKCEFNWTSPEFNWTAYFSWTGHLQDHGYVAVGARRLRPVSGGRRVSQEAYGIRTVRLRVHFIFRIKSDSIGIKIGQRESRCLLSLRND